jgi:2-keto-4-pentenoate hydratase
VAPDPVSVMTLDETGRSALGERLAGARERGERIEPPSATHDLTTADASAVQRAAVSAREGRPVGYKLGYTNPAVRERAGLDEPVHGRLLGPDVGRDPAVAVSGMVEPRVEPEVALVLDREPETAAVAGTAVRAALPAIEVVDRRVAEPFEPVDAVADTAFAAALVLGAPVPAERLDFEAVHLARDGERVATGVGAEAMGGPTRALGWLVDALAGAPEGDDGHALGPGTVVTTGTLTEPEPIGAGETATASFGRLGTVRVRGA